MLHAIVQIQRDLDKWGKPFFTDNLTFFYGLVKHVEIVGEATYMLTQEYKQSHPQLPWRSMERMRHVLVHGYYAMEAAYIWDTIEHDLPSIKPIIETLLQEFDENNG